MRVLRQDLSRFVQTRGARRSLVAVGERTVARGCCRVVGVWRHLWGRAGLGRLGEGKQGRLGTRRAVRHTVRLLGVSGVSVRICA